jgi:uncharacterized membrane protein
MRKNIIIFLFTIFCCSPLFLSVVSHAQSGSQFLPQKYAENKSIVSTKEDIVVPQLSPAITAPQPTYLDRVSSKIHKWLGYISLLLSVLLLAINKESWLHRMLGRLFIVSLATLNISALVIQVHGFTPFHYLAIVSLIIAALGMLPLIARRTKRSMRLHVQCMFGSIVAVFTGGVTEALVRIPAFPYYGDIIHTVFFAVPTTIVVCLVVNILTVERKWRETYIDTSPDG